MSIKKVAAVLAPVAAVILVVALLFVFAERTPEVYADGELIDVTAPRGILYEEDGDPADLGMRLVALAAGENFTPEQIEQIADLVAGLFEEIRWIGIDIEQLQAKVERLEERARQ